MTKKKLKEKCSKSVNCKIFKLKIRYQMKVCGAPKSKTRLHENLKNEGCLLFSESKVNIQPWVGSW